MRHREIIEPPKDSSVRGRQLRASRSTNSAQERAGARDCRSSHPDCEACNRSWRAPPLAIW